MQVVENALIAIDFTTYRYVFKMLMCILCVFCFHVTPLALWLVVDRKCNWRTSIDEPKHKQKTPNVFADDIC